MQPASRTLKSSPDAAGRRARGPHQRASSSRRASTPRSSRRSTTFRGALKREKPDIIVFTGELTDPSTVALVKEQLWEGAAVVGLTDHTRPRARSSAFAPRLRRRLPEAREPRRSARRAAPHCSSGGGLQRITGLIGESDAMREVMVQVEQMAPVSSTVLDRRRERNGEGARGARDSPCSATARTSRSSP